MRVHIVLCGCLATVSGCVGPPDGRRPVAIAQTDRALRQCLGGLDRLGAKYTVVAGKAAGGGCTNVNTIKLTSVGLPITNVAAIRCPLAAELAKWAQGPVQAAARKHLGARLARIESMGAYSCRNVIGNAASAGKLSEHATANAVDIGAFVLTDGRRVTVASGWWGAADERAFLRDSHRSACGPFKTVLGPDYNAAHRDHLHLDMGRGPFCR